MKTWRPFLAAMCVAFSLGPPATVSADEAQTHAGSAADTVLSGRIAETDTTADRDAEPAWSAWVIGFDVGLGDSEFDVTLEENSSEGGDLTWELGFYLGRQVTEKLQLGMTFRRWGGTDLFERSYRFTSIAVTADVFPFERSGFFLQAGIGYGWFSFEEDFWGPYMEVDDDGVLFVGAVGYQARRGKRFELGPEFVLERYQLDEQVFGGEAWTWAIGLRFQWRI
jgi:hypothetical protein